MFSSDYELDSLPLTFASKEDFEVYYATLCAKYPRKRCEATAIRDLSKEARELRAKGDFLRSLDKMQQSCEVRKVMFANDDYQLVTAQHHLCLTAVHYATHAFVLQHNAWAYQLFLQSKKIIMKTLPSVERPLFEVILHNNWANYWLRRKKYISLCQSCRATVVSWERVLSSVCAEALHAEGTTPAVLPAAHPTSRLITLYLYYRYGTAQLYVGKYKEGLDTLQKSVGILKGLLKEEKEAQNGAQQGINSVTLDCAVLHGAACPVSALNICITSPCSHFDSPWPFLQTMELTLNYNVGYALMFLLQFEKGVRSFELCGALLDSATKRGEKCNDYWVYGVKEGIAHCNSGISASLSIRRTVHKNTAKLGLQTHFFQEYSKKKRGESAAAPESLLQMMRAKQAEESKEDDNKSDCSEDRTEEEWRLLIPCLSKKVSYRDFAELTRRLRKEKAEQRFNDDDTFSQTTQQKSQSMMPLRGVGDIAARIVDKGAKKTTRVRDKVHNERRANTTLLQDTTPPQSVPNVLKKPQARPKADTKQSSPRVGLFAERLQKTPFKNADPHIGHPSTRALMLSKRVLIEQQQLRLNTDLIEKSRKESEYLKVLDEALFEMYEPVPAPLSEKAEDELEDVEGGAEAEGEGEGEGEGDGEEISDIATTVSTAVEICAQQARNLQKYFAGLEHHMLVARDVGLEAECVPTQNAEKDGYCDTEATEAPIAPLIEDNAIPAARVQLSCDNDDEFGSEDISAKQAKDAAQREFFEHNQQFDDFNYYTKQQRHLSRVVHTKRQPQHTPQRTLKKPKQQPTPSEPPPDQQNTKKFKSLVKAAVKSVTPEEEEAEYWNQGPGFFNGTNSVYSERKSRLTPVRSPHSYVKGCGSVGETQRRLRALLPHLDPHGEMYRMVTRELAANQNVLTRFVYKRRFQEIINVSKGFGSKPASPAADDLVVSPEKGPSVLAPLKGGGKNYGVSEEELARAVLAASWAISASICTSEQGDTAMHTAVSDTATLDAECAREVGERDDNHIPASEIPVPVPV